MGGCTAHKHTSICVVLLVALLVAVEHAEAQTCGLAVCYVSAAAAQEQCGVCNALAADKGAVSITHPLLSL